MKRTELHALVWSQPRTEIAKLWGISDVAVAKVCKKARIPAPTPGYWAKTRAKGRALIAALPMRLPGQSETVEIRRMNEYLRWNAPIDLERLPEPPSFSDPVEAIVDNAWRLLGPIRLKSDLNAAHQGLAKVLKSEELLRQKMARSGDSYYKPHFDEPRSQRQLRLFNSIFFCLDGLGAKCHLNMNREWVHHGEMRFLRGVVSMGGGGTLVEILEPETPKGLRYQDRAEQTTLRVGHSPDATVWTDVPGTKLEKCLPEVLRAILVSLETNLRTVEQRHYEFELERREAELARIAEEKREQDREQLRIQEARKAAIRREYFEAAKNFRRARQIRELVKDMVDHSEFQGEGGSLYATWAMQANEVADSIDPLKQPLIHHFKVGLKLV